MDQIRDLATLAQLLNLLLIPIVLFVYRVLKHMTVVEAFMLEVKKDRDGVRERLEEHDRALYRTGAL